MKLFNSLYFINIFASLFLLLFLSLCFVGGWYFIESRQHQERIQNVTASLIQGKKEVLKSEIHQVIDYIEFKKSQVLKRTRETIKSRVYEAHQLATLLYQQNKDQLAKADLKDLIRETLRPLRFQNGKGYFFATDLYGVEQLFADKPQLEGRNMLDMRGAGGKFVVRDMIDLVERQQEGFYEYQWSKPGQGSQRSFPKISYVKYFQPFHWFIGTGLYLDDIENLIQKETLKRIKAFRYAKDGYIYILNPEGTLLTHPIAKLVNKPLEEIENPHRVQVIKDILALSREKPSGFIEYDWLKPSTQHKENKLSYVTTYEPWSWIIGSGVYLDDIHEEIRAAQLRFNTVFRNQLILSGILFLAAFVLSLFFITLFSRKIKSGLRKFRDFFVKSTTEYTEINPSRLPFSEFVEIAAYANTMNRERKQAEAQLRQSENKYRQLIDTTPDAIALVDENGTFLTVNPAMAANFDLTPQELQGKCFSEVMPADLAEQRLMKSKETLKYDKVIYFEDQRNGRYLQNYYVPVALAGDERSFQVIARDITHQKKTEEALRNSEKSYKELFDSISDLIYTQDLEGTFLTTNPAMEKLFGYSKQEFLGRRASDFMKPEFQPLFDSEYLEHIKKDGQHAGIGVYFKKDGGKIYIEYNSKLVQPENGKPYISGMGRDVTERILAERKKKQLEAELQQVKKLEAIGTLAGGVAHNFNNQLSVVLGNLELVLTDLPAEAPFRENLLQALASTKKASGISSQLLAYLGQTTGTYTTHDLNDLCRSSLGHFEQSIPESITLQAVLSEQALMVNVNAHQIDQVVQNLISNALEAIGSHSGTIGLSTTTVFPEEILQAECFPHDWKPVNKDYACLEVLDTGPGMNPENIDKIFDPFYTTKFTGRGLGLAVVLGVVKACGGAISVMTEQGTGSRIHIFLPLVRTVSRDLEQKGQPSETLQSKNTVLLADDQELVRTMTKTMLEHLGYNVLLAAGGHEAIELFEQHQKQICCLLTDLSMPDLDGWETLKVIHKIQPDLPVILISGYDQAQIMNGENTERPQAYLSKPFQMAELQAALSEVLGEKRES